MQKYHNPAERRIILRVASEISSFHRKRMSLLQREQPATPASHVIQLHDILTSLGRWPTRESIGIAGMNALRKVLDHLRGHPEFIAFCYELANKTPSLVDHEDLVHLEEMHLKNGGEVTEPVVDRRVTPTPSVRFRNRTIPGARGIFPKTPHSK